MEQLRYNVFFKEHNYPTGWKEDLDYLLYHFFRDYETPGYFTEDIIPKLAALLEGKPHPEMPDDWGYFWGKVLPRKDYVYFIDPSEKGKVPAKPEYSWEGSALLNETLVEERCTKYLKIPTAELQKLCVAWDDFLTKNNK